MFSRISARLHAAVSSTRGREALLFMVFLLVSYIFWLMLTLNNEMQDDIEVPLELVNVPEGVTLISDVPDELKVSVRDKGTSLLKYKFGGMKNMRINWNDYKPSDNRLLLNRADLGARLRDYFGSSAQVVTVLPDSIRINYTLLPGRKVDVKVHADLKPAFGCIINGPVTINVDSVMVYSVTDLPHSFTSVETVPVVRGGLADTTYIDVRLKPVDGVRIEPEYVTLCVPVEPLIARKQAVPVVVKNVPHGLNVLTFPSRIELSYLVPMSEYNSVPYEVTAYADYDDIATASDGKIPVTLSLMPEMYHNIGLSPDSVEYIIETKH